MELIQGPGKVSVKLKVNGSFYNLVIEPRRTLLSVLRDVLFLTGTKKVCDQGECGACSVIIDRKLVYSCLTLAISCQGKEIKTIESIKDDRRLKAIQRAFIEQDAFQCGFCTPGQIMAVSAVLESNTEPDLGEIKRGVSGNLCRCGAYPKIFKAAETAVEYARSENNG